jgi:GNAT superfamily N-acetyltransferase
MSHGARIKPGSKPAQMPMDGDWQVRVASLEDVGVVAAAVGELLLELGGRPTSLTGMKEAARALVQDARAGVLLVADADSAIVGVLGASWQLAIHTAGEYGLIQDLWVHPSWRKTGIGRDLVMTLFEIASEQDVTRIEVGLPSERFPGLGETEDFYRRYGFSVVGTRMRRDLR